MEFKKNTFTEDKNVTYKAWLESYSDAGRGGLPCSFATKEEHQGVRKKVFRWCKGFIKKIRDCRLGGSPSSSPSRKHKTGCMRDNRGASEDSENLQLRGIGSMQTPPPSVLLDFLQDIEDGRNDKG